jgi:hypothetical protein
MTNPNIGKKVNIAGIQKTADKIKAQAKQSAAKAVLPSGGGQKSPAKPAKKTPPTHRPKPEQTPERAAAPRQTPQAETSGTLLSKADIANRLKNVKPKPIYFDFAVYEELQKMKARGQSASHYVNEIVRKDLGL